MPPNDTAHRLTLTEKETGLVEASGSLNMRTVPTALERSGGWFQRGGTLEIDLAGVQHSDSAGVALLLEWLRRANAQDCTVHYRAVPEQIRAIAAFGELEDILL